MNPGEGEETPEPEPVQLVDDADAHEFDEMDDHIDEFGNEIHEHLDDDDLDEDLDEIVDTSVPGHGHLSRSWSEEDEDDEDDEEEEEEFYANAGLPGGLNAFGMRGRFGELGNLRGEGAEDEDNGEDYNADEAEDEEDEEEDAGVGATIQGLLDINRRLHRLPSDGNVDFENFRHHPLMNALRGVFPIDSRMSRLHAIDPRLARIMTMLKSSDDLEVVSALHDLSGILLVPTEAVTVLAMLPVESVARTLVQLLHESENIEIRVAAARAIANLVDNGFHSALRALINAGIVPVLRQRFENIEYIDIIEQLIRVVEPVAAVEPKLVLESGCLLPCLNVLDFFGAYIQKQILSAVDICAHAVTASTVGPARELLAALPSPPSELVVGTSCQLVSAIAKRSPPEADLREVVPYTMWNTLAAYISSQTPHVARVLRACSHIAAKCPEYVQSRPGLASAVAATLSQGAQDPFAVFLSTPKETLFSGLKLLQVLLPPPPPVGSFIGPYRKPSPSFDAPPSPEEVREYALNAIPTAVGIYGASTNTPVRQLALLVIVQTVAAKPAGFSELAHVLQLAPFAAQVVAEGADSLALTTCGLDLAWDLVNDPQVLAELSATGVTTDLEGISGDAEPTGTYSPTDDLKPVAEFMARKLLQKLSTQVAGDHTKLLDEVRAGNINATELATAPLPELLRSGLLDALNQAGERTLRHNLSPDLVSVLQGAVGRLERFRLQLAPGHSSSSLVNVIGRSVKVHVSDRNDPHSGWYLSVPAVASLNMLGHFVRAKFAARRILEANQENDHIAFYVGDVRVPADVSVLKALHSQLNHSSHDHHNTPQLQFERVPGPEPPAEQPAEPDLMRYGDLGKAIQFLAILAHENETRNELVPWSTFQNAKLTAKLTRQMTDTLAVAASMLPQWTFDTVMRAPFLYPLRIRLQFVQLTSCGLGRNLRLLRQMESRNGDDAEDGGGEPDDDDRVLGRHRRQKYRLARNSFLQGALRLLEMSSKNPAVLDVMFYGEEGTGRGPTQEFFALASRELSRPDLGIWRETPTGLFPSPEAPSRMGLRVLEAVGRLIARALLDKRILDFRLSPAFFSVVLGSPSNLETLHRVDAQLAASLELVLHGSAADVADMGLDFVLPGTSIELVPDGANKAVTADNAADFVARIVDRVVGTGISEQLNAFRKGFNSTIPISALHAFMADELVALCGAGRAEDWSEAALLKAFRADHGYSMHSVPVQSLVRVLASFDNAERRKFLMFATGSPHLPIGGFKALNPPFTVVVKRPDNDAYENDQYLPSVMTCVNYLKLPEYSSEEVMRAQLKLAMTEGSEAFPLS